MRCVGSDRYWKCHVLEVTVVGLEVTRVERSDLEVPCIKSDRYWK